MLMPWLVETRSGTDDDGVDETGMLSMIRHARRCMSGCAGAPPVSILNTMTGQKEALVGKRSPFELFWYTCGPTVYDRAHLGHARTYVSLDIVHRILAHCFGYAIRHAMNITNVDDKIIARAQADGTDWKELSDTQERLFIDDVFHKLECTMPNVVCRVTDHMDGIVRMIQKLEGGGFAYSIPGDGVYFDVQRWSSESKYGIWRSMDNLQPEVEDSSASTAETKRSPSDFALWKLRDPGSEEPTWVSPWGSGRPGWHIECSAMIDDIFGAEGLDVHAGGIDLQFPHHENEVAQSEAYRRCCDSTGTNQLLQPWCSTFVHFGHLHISGKKMSKSLKNFTTVEQMLEQTNGDRDLFRIFCLQSKYNSHIEYSPDRIEDAMHIKERISGLFTRIQSYAGTMPVGKKWDTDEQKLDAAISSASASIRSFLADDLHTPLAMRQILQLVTDTNEYLTALPPSQLSLELVKSAERLLRHCLGTVFGLEFAAATPSSANSKSFNDPSALIDTAVRFRADVRRSAIKEKEYRSLRNAVLTACDEFRNVKFPKRGVQIHDQKDFTSTWERCDE